MNEVSKAFGENLKRIRKAAGYTQQTLSEKIGLSAVTIGGYETGIREPNLKKLLALAELLGVQIDEFFGRGEKKNLEFRFERAEKLMIMLGHSIEIKINGIYLIIQIDFTLDWNPEPYEVIEKRMYFRNKLEFVTFVEIVEKQAIRENKTFQAVFDEKFNEYFPDGV